jgi:hypothetical protein
MTSESKLQQDCFVYFWNTYPELRGTMWMVHNNAKNAFQGAILKAMGMVKGVSDLQWLHNGKFYAIELKTATGRQSKEQIQWQGGIEAQGGTYVLLRSFDEFRTFVQSVIK